MSEVERYESWIPARRVVWQGRGHGPVVVRWPGVEMAWCVEPGCGWRGPNRGGDHEAREADGQLHLKDVEDANDE